MSLYLSYFSPVHHLKRPPSPSLPNSPTSSAKPAKWSLKPAVEEACRQRVVDLFPDICPKYLDEVSGQHSWDLQRIIDHILDQVDNGLPYAKRPSNSLKRKAPGAEPAGNEGEANNSRQTSANTKSSRRERASRNRRECQCCFIETSVYQIVHSQPSSQAALVLQKAVQGRQPRRRLGFPSTNSSACRWMAAKRDSHQHNGKPFSMRTFSVRWTGSNSRQICKWPASRASKRAHSVPMQPSTLLSKQTKEFRLRASGLPNSQLSSVQTRDAHPFDLRGSSAGPRPFSTTSD